MPRQVSVSSNVCTVKIDGRTDTCSLEVPALPLALPHQLPPRPALVRLTLLPTPPRVPLSTPLQANMAPSLSSLVCLPAWPVLWVARWVSLFSPSHSGASHRGLGSGDTSECETTRIPPGLVYDDPWPTCVVIHSSVLPRWIGLA